MLLQANALRRLIGFPGATLPVVLFPEDSAAVQDSPRLALIVLDPETILRRQIVEFVSRGAFGLAVGANDDGAYGRLGQQIALWPQPVVGAWILRDIAVLTAARAGTASGRGGQSLEHMSCAPHRWPCASESRRFVLESRPQVSNSP